MLSNSFSSWNSKVNWSTIIVVSIIMAIFPIIGLCLSVLFFRHKYAICFFILFSFYFGWFYEPQMDLLVHYEHFKHLAGKSLLDSWSDPMTLKLGKELYPVMFKYLLGLISDSPNFFSACACTIYSSLFIIGILIPLRNLYTHTMSIPAWLLFLGIIFTVEYYWFLGFRFWSGAFVFTGFYLRYINSGDIKYLWLTILCICFHFSLLPLCILALFNNIFKRYKFIYYYIILLLSFLIRFSNFSFYQFVGRLRFLDGYLNDNISNESIRISVEKLTVEQRIYGNQFYLLREQIAILGPLIVIFILYKIFNKAFFIQNSKLWGFCILLLSISNFGYSNITFYDRFFKISLLFFYIFAYMFFMSEQIKLNTKMQLNMILVLILPVLYLIITPLVEQRGTLSQLKLWFNSFFIG